MQLNDVLIFFFFNQEYSTTLPAIKSDQQGDKTWLISGLRLKNLELISYSKDLQRHSYFTPTPINDIKPPCTLLGSMTGVTYVIPLIPDIYFFTKEDDSEDFFF